MTAVYNRPTGVLPPRPPYGGCADMARSRTAVDEGSRKREADNLLELAGFSCSSDGHHLAMLHDSETFFHYFLAVNFKPGLTAVARALYQMDLEDSVEVARVLLRELPLQENLALRVATTMKTHQCNLLRLISTIATALVREKFAPELAARSEAADREEAATLPTPPEDGETAPTASDGDTDGWQPGHRRRRRRPALRRGTFEGLSTVFDRCGLEYVVVQDETELFKAASALGGALFHGCIATFSSSIRTRGIEPRPRRGEFSPEGAFYVTDKLAFAARRAIERSGGELFDGDLGKPPGPDSACVVLFGEPNITGLFAVTLSENHHYRQFVYAHVTNSDEFCSYPELWDTAVVVNGPICRSADPEVLRNYADVQCYQEGTQTAYKEGDAAGAIHAALVDKAILLAKGFCIRSTR